MSRHRPNQINSWFCDHTHLTIFIDRIVLAKQGDNVYGSIRPSVHPSVCALTAEQFDPLGAQLCRVQQRAKKNHYQCRVFVCVSNNRADAVDRLFIIHSLTLNSLIIESRSTATTRLSVHYNL